MKLYVVWEKSSYCEYDIILITPNEEKAKELSNEPFPSTADTKMNQSDGDNERWYEVKEMNQYYPFNY